MYQDSVVVQGLNKSNETYRKYLLKPDVWASIKRVFLQKLRVQPVACHPLFYDFAEEKRIIISATGQANIEKTLPYWDKSCKKPNSFGFLCP